MKVLNRKEFLELPPGTLYSRYNDGIISGLELKGSTCYDGNKAFDWFFLDLIGNIAANDTSEYLEKSESKEFDLDFELVERDGCFEETDQFAVYDQTELNQFINRLKSGI